MQNLKRTILFVFFIQSFYFSPSLAVLERAGYETLQSAIPIVKEAVDKLSKTGVDITTKAIPAIEKISEALKTVEPALKNGGVEAVKALVPSLNELAKVAPQTSADFGKNFGLGTTEAIGGGIMLAGTKAKAAALAAKKAAVIIASSPAAPYVAIGVGVIVVSYGGYKVYRYYHPTEAQLAAAQKLQIEIQKSQAKLCKMQHAAEITKKESELKEALIKHATDQCNDQGIPLACQKEALAFALVAGNKKVEKIVDSFTKYKPQQERWA